LTPGTCHHELHFVDALASRLQLLRTRIAVASTQQTRHQSVFSDITSKLKQQVDR